LPNNEQYSGDTPFHEEGGTVVFNKPKSQEEIARQRRENEQHEFARAQVKTNKKLAWFTGLLVLATFCTIGVGVWQASISQQSANTAQKAVDVASKSLQETARSNKQQADLAQHSLDTTIDSFRIDERAWIELGTIKPLRLLAVSQPFAIYTYEIYPKNIGKTQARNITIRTPEGSSGPWIMAESKGAIEHLQQQFARLPPIPGPRTLGGGETSPVPIVLAASAPMVTQGKVPYYSFFVGKIDYTDAFDIQHWITYCYVVYDAQGELKNCKYGNDEDRNSETPPKKWRYPVTE
jgi:hypothetical protein